jgi:hypothetical protein
VDNSIRLKELQVVSGAFKKGDKGLRLLFLCQKGFVCVKGGCNNSASFQRVFFLRIGIGEFFWDGD